MQSFVSLARPCTPFELSTALSLCVFPSLPLAAILTAPLNSDPREVVFSKSTVTFRDVTLPLGDNPASALADVVARTCHSDDRFIDLSLRPWYWLRKVQHGPVSFLAGCRGVLGLPPVQIGDSVTLQTLSEFAQWAVSHDIVPPAVMPGPLPLLVAGSPALWVVSHGTQPSAAQRSPHYGVSCVVDSLQADGVLHVGVFSLRGATVITGRLPCETVSLPVVVRVDTPAPVVTSFLTENPPMPTGFTVVGQSTSGVVVQSPSGVLLTVLC